MPPIWKQPISVDALNKRNTNTASSHLGMEFVELGDDFICARVPVDQRTIQPFGLLHGGVSVVLAETLGSTAAFLAAPPGTRSVVGVEINANHLKSVREGWVTGTARPLHIGRRTQVWQIELVNGNGELTCVSRITLAVISDGN